MNKEAKFRNINETYCRKITKIFPNTTSLSNYWHYMNNMVTKWRSGEFNSPLFIVDKNKYLLYNKQK